MCGPASAKVGTKDHIEAAKESTGVDQSSSSGLFVLSIEHLHGGGGVLLFVGGLCLVFYLAWWCARRGRSVGGQTQQQQQQAVNQVAIPMEPAAPPAPPAPGGGGENAWAPGWRPS